MPKGRYVEKENYSRFEDNRYKNENRKVKKSPNRNQEYKKSRKYPNREFRTNNREYRSDIVHSRDRLRSRAYDFSNEGNYRQTNHARRPREKENYYNYGPNQRDRQYNFEKNKSANTVQKSSKSILFSFMWTLLFYTFSIGIIMTAIMFSFSSKSNASIFGYRFYTVLTNSMVPQEDGPKDGFYAGDVVVMKMMDGDKVKKGDVVTFPVGDSGQRYLTHRVVDRRDELNGEKGDYVVTKGDSNKSNDPPIEARKIIGRVIFSIPKMGLVLDFIREEFWACLVSVLSLYGFFLVLKAYLFPKQ